MECALPDTDAHPADTEAMLECGWQHVAAQPNISRGLCLQASAMIGNASTAHSNLEALVDRGFRRQCFPGFGRVPAGTRTQGTRIGSGCHAAIKAIAATEPIQEGDARSRFCRV